MSTRQFLILLSLLSVLVLWETIAREYEYNSIRPSRQLKVVKSHCFNLFEGIGKFMAHFGSIAAYLLGNLRKFGREYTFIFKINASLFDLGWGIATLLLSPLWILRGYVVEGDNLAKQISASYEPLFSNLTAEVYFVMITMGTVFFVLMLQRLVLEADKLVPPPLPPVPLAPPPTEPISAPFTLPPKPSRRRTRTISS